MKKTTTPINLLILLFFSIGVLNAQTYVTIDSTKIIPTNPTTADTIKMIMYTTFPNGACNLTSSVIHPTGSNSIDLLPCYKMGIASVICHSVDTFILGKYNAVGTQSVAVHLGLVDPLIDSVHCTTTSTDPVSYFLLM